MRLTRAIQYLSNELSASCMIYCISSVKLHVILIHMQEQHETMEMDSTLSDLPLGATARIHAYVGTRTPSTSYQEMMVQRPGKKISHESQATSLPEKESAPLMCSRLSIECSDLGSLLISHLVRTKLRTNTTLEVEKKGHTRGCFHRILYHSINSHE